MRFSNQLCRWAMGFWVVVATAGDLDAAGDPAALQVAVAAAEVVRRDAVFEFRATPWRTAQGVQVVDFNRQFNGEFKGIADAQIELTMASAGSVHFGVAGAGRVQIRIDDQPVFEREFTEATKPIEYAYDHFRWPAGFDLSLSAGTHRILVTVTARAGAGRYFLQACDVHGGADERVKFGTAGVAGGDWQLSGPRPDDPSKPFSGVWQPILRPEVMDFAINPKATFKRHSLVEWHYATGATHLAILAAADATGDAGLRAQVDRLAQFTLENLPRQRAQFEQDHAWRGANYRLFRGCLLDDTSAPALPYMELVRRGELPAAASLVEDILQFVLREHPRLGDGTLCRDEPEAQTVWADDLFMSTAFLARAADWKKSPLLWDEVVKQVRGFHRHLFNPETGLYFHGYYAARKTPVAFQWGRANGWMAWAVSEVLSLMPTDHAARSELIAIQRAHLTALLRYQEKSGLWHQVLDRPESYEETSASAMFLIAMARGLKGGWLDSATFAAPANRTWAALRTKIDATGVVHGISGSTAIGDSYDHYFKRPQVDHDPRGMGAFILAAVLAADLPAPEKP